MWQTRVVIGQLHWPDLRVYVAGHRGLVGSAVVRALEAAGVGEVIGWASTDLDLRDREQVIDALVESKPDVVIDAAAKVGGILANSTQPVDFLRDNSLIQINVMDAAHRANVDNLLFLGSSCIYPRLATQPIRETSLMTGPLEPTNQAYAMAKISGIFFVEAYRRQYGRSWISAMPTNLYGPGDNFDLESSHVPAAFIRRFHEAKVRGDKQVTMWGTGSALREFLHVDDLARACLTLLEKYDDPETINVGCGSDLSIFDFAHIVREVVGFEGEIQWDSSRPDGMPRKLLDVSRLNELGWSPSINLKDGLSSTYEWFLGSSWALQ